MSILHRAFARMISQGSASTPSLDHMLEKFDAELENFQTLVQPVPESKPRTPFDNPGITFDQMYVSQLSAGQILSLIPVMLPLQMFMRLGTKLYDGTYTPTRSEASPAFLENLESLARRLGAADIRYIKVPRNAIFKHKGIPYQNAIVITVEMDRDNISTAPSFSAFKEVATGYKNLAVIGYKLARIMRKNGFAAYPGTALGGITDYTYLGELTGLGAIGYHGLLITPNEGARLRISTIYTNITNLPIENENPHAWVRDFCAMCKKCIRSCPVEAIFDEPVPRGDGGMQSIDHASCRDYFSRK